MRNLVVCIATCAALLSGCGSDTPTSPDTTFGLTLRPAAVPAGTTAEGIVTLANRPPHSVDIHLSSSDGVASVPSTVTVPAQTWSTVFQVTTRVVAADTTATITATAGDVMQQVPLRVISPAVVRPATLDVLELEPSVVHGGENGHGTVRLTTAAPTGSLTLNIKSSNSAANVPNTVLVPAGALSATFAIATQPVTLDTELEITAWYSDQTRTATLLVSR
jgi:hypothetical protein